ncbi:MAG: hypothetical protein R3A79_10085 [Nannocystaceae bacterium]
MTRHLLPALLPPALALLSSGCVIIADGTTATAGESSSDSDSDSDSGGDAPLLALDGPCGPTSVGDELAVITTDFVNGGVSVAHADMSVDVDVVAATTDTVATGHGGDLFLLHRYGFNAIDVVDGGDWSIRASYDVAVDGVAEPNPQALVFASAGEHSGHGVLTLLGAPELQILDLAGDAATKVGSVDISAFADADGNPEAGAAIACGSIVLVGIQRLDAAFVPVDSSYIIAVDTATESAIDLDPDTEGLQGLELAGAWPRQIRVDPGDPSGETILVLTAGIERIHVPTMTRSWAVDAAELAAVGVAGFAPQGFVTDAAGDVAYLIATDGAWPASAVWRLSLDADTPSAPEKIISGLMTNDSTLERVGDQLWVGDANPAASGMRVWDLAQDPPAELTSSPLDTGLPPYTVARI